MSTPTFPTVLPRPTVSLSGEKSDVGNIRTTMASGRVRARNATDDKRRSVRLRFSMYQDEFDAFQSWWYYKINNGTSDFEIELNLDGAGYVSYVVTPMSQYSFRYVPHKYWEISFQVLVTQVKYMDETFFDLWVQGNGFELITSVLVESTTTLDNINPYWGQPPTL